MSAQPTLGLFAYVTAGIAWSALIALLAARGRGRGLGRWLLLASAVEAAWAAVLAASVASSPPPRLLVLVVESLRPLAWSGMLLALLWDRSRRPGIGLGGVLAVSIAIVQFGASAIDENAQYARAASIVAAVFGLLCVEQVYRNTPENRRWAVKFLCLAIASLSAFEIALHADALLFTRLDPGWWVTRGFAHALVVPLIAVAASRMPGWRLDVQVSREVVFHTATLLASGAFLLAVAAVGYGLKLFGGDWGSVAQALALFVGLTAAAALAASGSLRASLRVALAKHFFSYRYDYRAEWLRLTELLAAPDAPDASLSMRALQGISALVESPGGTLWVRQDDGSWRIDAKNAGPERAPIDADEPLARFLARRRWIVELPEWQAHPGRYEDLALPHWLVSDPGAWLVVPLLLNDQLVGIVELRRPIAPVPVDWEVRDILKTAGRQLAGTIAVRDAVEKLLQSRQFDSFNRMSAFVVHDLKNLVAQLALLVANAGRHRDNPEFQRDMLETVENVLDRMQGLLLQLRVGARPIEPPAPVRLVEALRAAVAAKKGQCVEPVLDIEPGLDAVEVIAHRDRLERVIGHLVQNAIDATPPDGAVRAIAMLDGAHAELRVVDTGRGMSRDFVDTRLFKPFASTKEHGMGIGAYESREYLREIGGTLSVATEEWRGSTFTVRLPVHAARDLPREAS